MKKLTNTYNIFDVVLVPFPFIESDHSKKRPAIVLSSIDKFNRKAKASVMAMITTSFHHPWPFDCPISDINAAGLPVESMIRMKLFTLDNCLIIKKIGTISEKDQKKLTSNLRDIFSY